MLQQLRPGIPYAADFYATLPASVYDAGDIAIAEEGAVIADDDMVGQLFFELEPSQHAGNVMLAAQDRNSTSTDKRIFLARQQDTLDFNRRTMIGFCQIDRYACPLPRPDEDCFLPDCSFWAHAACRLSPL